MNWISATTLEQLQKKGSVLFRREQQQIVLFWVDGQVFALDNRCPHEGYPLQQGTVASDTCVLTCQWHNWKFDMKTGQCVVGEDHVRTYETKQDNGQIWVNLQDPSPEIQQTQILQGLQTGVAKRQYGRISREITRLVDANLDPLVAVERALFWTYEQFEFGMTHAQAATADWVAQSDRFVGNAEQQILCLTEAVDHIAFDALRHPHYPYTKKRLSWDSTAFLDAVEREDEIHAIALLRDAIETKVSWDSLEYTLCQAALRHYNDFGHSLIYVQKTGELLQRLQLSSPQVLLFPLVRAFCYSTREDLLPEFRRYAEFLQKIPESYPVSTSVDSGAFRPLTDEDKHTLFVASTNQAMDWVCRHVEHTSLDELYLTLMEAAARNFLFYNTQYQEAFDKPVGDNVGWLDFSHGITFAHAVRILASRHPALWRAGLLQMACFVGRNQSYVDRQQDVSAWLAEKPASFFADAWERVCDHGMWPPIFSAHWLKTVCAVREEIQALDQTPKSSSNQSCRQFLLASLDRFLHSSIKQKHVRRVARQSMALIHRS